MVELVLVYCMLGHASVCKEQRPVFEDPLTLMSCMMNGQKTGAEYVRDHPLWKLASWRCEVNKPSQQPI
jgi:hypothetical protein